MEAPPQPMGGQPAMAVAQPMGGQPAMAVAQPMGGQPAMAVAQPMPMQGQPAMAVAQPMGAQPGYGQAQQMQPMQQMPMQPQMVPMQQQQQAAYSNGGGVGVLAQFGDLFIKQQVEILEAFTGFETANAYDILGTAGGVPQQVFFAGEDSDCCERQMCGPSRSFRMNIFSPANPAQPIFSIDRPLRCKPPLCCCYLQELTVYNGPVGGAPIGQLLQQYACCGSEFDIVVGSQLVFKIAGPICVCDGPFCGDQEFFITSPQGQHIQTPAGPARITKMGSRGFEGAIQEMATDADNFGVTFPATATPEAKAILLAAVFLIGESLLTQSACYVMLAAAINLCAALRTRY